MFSTIGVLIYINTVIITIFYTIIYVWPAIQYHYSSMYYQKVLRGFSSDQCMDPDSRKQNIEARQGVDTVAGCEHKPVTSSYAPPQIGRYQETTINYDKNGSIRNVTVVSNYSTTAMKISKKVASLIIKFTAKFLLTILHVKNVEILSH